MADYENNVLENMTTDQEIVPTIADETAIIAENTKILGNLKTKGNIAIAGVVEGDIYAAGNVIVTGIVRGNICANNISLDTGELIANFKANEQIVIKEGVVLNGDLECKDATIMGVVNGDIECSDKLLLISTSKVNGKIKCAQLGAELGAKIVGRVTIK